MASPGVCATLAAILSRNANYATLNRDASRSRAARQLLEASCESLGLARGFQGLGLPVLESNNGQVLSTNTTRPARKRKAAYDAVKDFVGVEVTQIHSPEMVTIDANEDVVTKLRSAIASTLSHRTGDKTRPDL